jgi:ribosomal protein S18 acetylase RimI-like enzyme
MSQDNTLVTIHIATPADAANLARLISAFDDERLTASQVIERLGAVQDHETTFLAKVADEAVGLVCLRLAAALSAAAPQAEITELFVRKDHAGEQIERALLENAETLARQRQARQLLALVGLNNAERRSIYRAQGFHDYALALCKILPAAPTP